MKVLPILLFSVLSLVSVFAVEPVVTSVKVKPQRPWNIDDITISYSNAPADGSCGILLSASNTVDNVMLPMKTIYDPETYETNHWFSIAGSGTKKLVWNAVKDLPRYFKIKDAAILAKIVPMPPEYYVVDLAGGANAASYPVTKLLTEPEGGFNTDEYKTTKLVLRRIWPNRFWIGDNQHGGKSYENITLTNSFYIGIFEMTQKQWELVMGENPSSYTGDMRPVENVSYDAIRGSIMGACWPTNSLVDANSFLGKLQSRTGISFDLPTETQWEFACRAESESDYNSFMNYTSMNSDTNMLEVGRYYYNNNDGKGGFSQHTVVGSYMPNYWGLYDMHGNVYEWCLDWFGEQEGNKIDPLGPTSGVHRVLRGGSWFCPAFLCTSAYRYKAKPSDEDGNSGFRVVFRATDD